MMKWPTIFISIIIPFVILLLIVSVKLMIPSTNQWIPKYSNQREKGRDEGILKIQSRKSDLPITSSIDGIHGSSDAGENVINFAIIGFPKCSTTFLRNRLLHTRQFFYGNNQTEIHHLRNNQVQEFVNLFANISDPLIKMKGFKCPDVLYSNNALLNLKTYFPSAGLVVVVRHPVLWFQSFYNYRVRKGYNMPKPTDLCLSFAQGS